MPRSLHSALAQAQSIDDNGALDTVMLAALHMVTIDAGVAVRRQFFERRGLNAIYRSRLLGLADALMHVRGCALDIVRAERD